MAGDDDYKGKEPTPKPSTGEAGAKASRGKALANMSARWWAVQIFSAITFRSNVCWRKWCSWTERCLVLGWSSWAFASSSGPTSSSNHLRKLGKAPWVSMHEEAYPWCRGATKCSTTQWEWHGTRSTKLNWQRHVNNSLCERWHTMLCFFGQGSISYRSLSWWFLVQWFIIGTRTHLCWLLVLSLGQNCCA